MSHRQRPALRGAGLALLAAGLFGLSTPLVQHFGQGLGPFGTAALLYGGAAVVALRQARRTRSRAAVADGALGAVVGPVRWPGACSAPAVPARR
jgi:uncharacterized membrane protein HdeD (DUF308 family)